MIDLTTEDLYDKWCIYKGYNGLDDEEYTDEEDKT